MPAADHGVLHRGAVAGQRAAGCENHGVGRKLDLFLQFHLAHLHVGNLARAQALLGPRGKAPGGGLAFPGRRVPHRTDRCRAEGLAVRHGVKLEFLPCGEIGAERRDELQRAVGGAAGDHAEKSVHRDGVVRRVLEGATLDERPAPHQIRMETVRRGGEQTPAARRAHDAALFVTVAALALLLPERVTRRGVHGDFREFESGATAEMDRRASAREYDNLVPLLRRGRAAQFAEKRVRRRTGKTPEAVVPFGKIAEAFPEKRTRRQRFRIENKIKERVGVRVAPRQSRRRDGIFVRLDLDLLRPRVDPPDGALREGQGIVVDGQAGQPDIAAVAEEKILARLEDEVDPGGVDFRARDTFHLDVAQLGVAHPVSAGRNDQLRAVAQ